MRRALGPLLAATALALALVPPAAAERTQGPPAAGPALRLLSQPVAIAPDGDFGVLVEVADAPEATELAVDIYDRAEADDLIGLEPEDGPAATFPPTALPEATAAGEPRTSGFSIALYPPGEDNPDPAWGYRLDEPGVYPVRIRLRDGDGDVLAVLMTAVVRLPEADQSTTPTEVAVLIEGHRPPPDDAEARATLDAVDPSLLRELAPVLDALEARPELPATWSLTPETVARLAGDGDAASVLGDLRGVLAVEGRDVLDAPYVDIDPTSLVREGLGGELGRQRDLGRQVLRDLLEEPITGTWRLAPHLDEATLDQLRQKGIFRTVVAGDVLAAGAGATAPAEVDTGDGASTLVAASEVYELGAASSDPVLAAHRLLARLAVASTDREDAAHIVVDVDPATAPEATLAIVFDALALGTPLVRATTLDALLDAPAVPGATLATATPPDLGRYPAELRAARAELGSYASMVGRRSSVLAEPERTLAISAAAELDLEERRADVDGVRRELAEVFSSIRLPESDTVTLGARAGEFPLPIDSDLDEPVQVVIQLDASDRLDFPDDRIEATLDEERVTVDIAVRARAAGDTPVRITVRSPDDGVVLAESRYVVRSTAVSGVGILLTVGAAGFLVVWWGRHLLRTRRARSV